MPTAPTRQPDPATRRRDPDPVPRHRRKYRAILTIVSLGAVTVFVVLLAAGIATDNAQLTFTSVAGALVGIALSVVAQRPEIYSWIDSEPIRQPKPDKPAPRQRKPSTVPVPTHQPDRSLGADFEYIVGAVRHLVSRRQSSRFEVMQQLWDQTDWSDDLPQDEWDAYRDAVVYVRASVYAHPDYEEVTDIDAAMAGRLGTANPDVFLAELERLSMPAAAVAAAMLVRHRDDVTDDILDRVLYPWQRARLPYRIGHIAYRWNSTENCYLCTEIPGAAPDPVRLIRPDDVFTAAGERIAVQPDRQTPAPQPPTVAPAPAPVPPRPRRNHPAASRAEPAPKQPDPADEVDLDEEGEYGYSINSLLYATRVVILGQVGSTSTVQRQAQVGFGAACNIMDALEDYGIVGPRPQGNGPREVLVPVDALEDALAHVRECEIG